MTLKCRDKRVLNLHNKLPPPAFNKLQLLFSPLRKTNDTDFNILRKKKTNKTKITCAALQSSCLQEKANC